MYFFPSKAYTFGQIIIGSDNLLYGLLNNLQDTATYIFSFNPKTRIYTDVKVFKQKIPQPTNPGNIMFLNDSVIYGVSNLGGDNNSGFIFSYNIHIKEIIQKHSFAKDSTGFVIIGPLVKGNNNILYGVQQHGGKNDFGDFFSFNILTNQYTSIWDFPTNDFGKL